MYKPPENSNRVKLITSKFECIRNGNSTILKPPPLIRSKTSENLILTKTRNQVENSLNLQDSSCNLIFGNRTDNTHLVISRQLSDPAKRNIKRTPAFRLDRNVIDQKTAFKHLKNNLKDYSPQFNSYPTNCKEGLMESKINGCGKNNFSEIRNKFNEEKTVSVMHHTDVTKNETENNILKLLYAEAIPKSRRINNNSQNDNIHNLSTLKISDKERLHVSDDESSYSKTSFIKNNLVYGSLRCKKSLENLVDLGENGLTDTLKNALRKPLPDGPAPRKPPRTFAHSPIKESNLSKEFADQLNKELQKNVIKKAHKGDAKYMLEKLETALKHKGKLLRKAVNTGSGATVASEEDSDNEKNKYKYRILPNVPEQSIYYSTPPIENSSKFNFNCLSGSLGCVSPAYEQLKEPTSSFFVKCKTEEPVYAEPFQYPVDVVQKRVKNGENKDEKDEASDSSTIRRSVHYASSPVPDVKPGDTNGQLNDMKHNEQQILIDMDRTSPSLSTSSSEMDSLVVPQTETFVSYVKVKDRVQAIEASDSDKTVLPNNPSITSDTIPNETSAIHDSRLKNVALQLKNTLDQSFSASESVTTSMNENDEKEDKLQTNKFVTYVNKVRSKLQYRLRKKKENLFHCCLLVALNRNVPYIKSKYPPNVEAPYKIEDLCFPEVECGPMDYSIKAQCYSLIITNEAGERTFGYCRRVLPEGSTACLPLVYCILSKHRAPGFYRKILEELESCHGYPDKFRDSLLGELYNCKFPMPGETIAINCSKIVSNSGCHTLKKNEASVINSTNGNNCDTNSRLSDSYKKNELENSLEDENELDLKSFVVVCNNGEYGSLIRKNTESRSVANGIRGASAILPYDTVLPDEHLLLKRSNSSPSLTSDLEDLPSELVFMRPRDSRHEENALSLLGEVLKVPVLQKVFCSLLLERKVIFVSCVLSKLSSCIEALQIILYPFSWQHTIIPVLPRSLWEIVEAPTPLVCGVLSAEVVNNHIIEDAIIVDLDEGTVLLQVGDEDKILPASLIHTLKDGLNLAYKVTSNEHGGAHNIFLSDAFLRVFIQSCGHYKSFIINGELKKTEFIQHSKQRGKHLRQFLRWFTETTMFYNFKELAETDSSNLDLFDQRIKIYSSESATEILNKMKYWRNYRSMLSSNLHRFQ